MIRLRTSITAAFVILLIATAYAIAMNAGEYLAPTQAESDSETVKQVARICDAPGWSNNTQVAYEKACKMDFDKRKK